MRVAAAWAREAAAAPDKVRPCPTALVHAYDRFEPCKGSGDGISGSEFCVPLLHKERCLGVLRVRHPKEGTFWPWQETVLKGLADRAVLALLTHDVQEKLRTNEKIATLGGLYATLLHRLRNDVRAIRTYAQLAEEDYAQVAADEAGTDAAAAHLDKLTRLAGTILEQVDRISQWTKTDRQLVDVRGAIERGLAKAGATAELDVPDRLPRVSADPELLAEVFGILAKNGVEAMPEGGRLRIAAEHRGPWVVVRVRDTGTGIDALTMRTLFQPKHSSKGLGIGLWLAHSYAELIGGRLDVDTEPGVGSTFILGLPTPPNAPPAGDPHE
jgi:signal transduction histidine kinase